MFKLHAITHAELDKSLDIEPTPTEEEDLKEMLQRTIDAIPQEDPVMQLTEIATELDKKGLHKLADMADALVLDALNCEQSAIESVLDSYRKIHQLAAVKTASVRTWDEIRDEYNKKHENHHHLRLECTQCGDAYTCRCRAPKVKEVGICPECVAKSKTAQVKTAQVKKDDSLTFTTECPFGLPIPQGCKYVGMGINIMTPHSEAFESNRVFYNTERTHEACPFAAKIMAKEKAVDCNFGTTTEGRVPPKMYHSSPIYPQLWQAFSVPSSGCDRGYQQFHDFNSYSIWGERHSRGLTRMGISQELLDETGISSKEEYYYWALREYQEPDPDSDYKPDLALAETYSHFMQNPEYRYSGKMFRVHRIENGISKGFTKANLMDFLHTLTGLSSFSKSSSFVQNVFSEAAKSGAADSITTTHPSYFLPKKEGDVVLLLSQTGVGLDLAKVLADESSKYDSRRVGYVNPFPEQEEVLAPLLSTLSIDECYYFTNDHFVKAYIRGLTRLAKKLSVWLDDVREMPDNFDIHVKTAKEAIDLLSSGKVGYVSLDHDLGGSEDPTDTTHGTGYDVAKWIEEHAYKGDLAPISYNVHSANPAGRERMLQALMNADKFWSSQRDKH